MMRAINDSNDNTALHQCARQLADDYLPCGWERISSSPFSRVAFNKEQQLYYKEFLPRSPAETLKALLRGSRAQRARKADEALRFAGIDAPQTICWGKVRGGCEYVFSAAAPGKSITAWLRKAPDRNDIDTLRQRRELLEGLGTMVGRLHATGFIHGDLRPGNVLANFSEQQFRYTLLDNERTVRRSPPPGKMLLRNLMQLNMLSPMELSRTDRLRFFRAWQRQMRSLSSVEAKILAAEAYQWAMRRLDIKNTRSKIQG